MEGCEKNMNGDEWLVLVLVLGVGCAPTYRTPYSYSYIIIPPFSNHLSSRHHYFASP